EVLDPETSKVCAPGETGELIITNLGRIGYPILRYRTGDLVRLNPEPCVCGRTWTRFEGGVLGRADDMVIVRGVNVFPSAIENLVRRFEEVDEYRVTVSKRGELGELSIEVELAKNTDSENTRQAIAHTLQDKLGLRPSVTVAPHGTLPRFEMKAKRFHASGR
ncbi:MAG TPA: phenylacetate--CoA ligase, partial [Deltaproteobacteria bacterium]|nr:phenylacetate--CoA ligase [Deltaproteobacteria bacterium]